MIRLLLAYLVLINLVTYGVYWWDKHRARTGGRRISEGELLLWVLAGGAVGAALSMHRHRHKIRKTSFKVAFAAVVALQLGLLWYVTRS